MVVVQEVMHCGLMELTRATHCSTSDGTTTFLGNTTAVEAQVVCIVHLALSLELCKSLLSVATSSRGSSRYVSRSITSRWVVALIKLSLRNLTERVRIFAAQKVVICSRLHDREHSVSLLDLSELLGIGGSATNDIWVMPLN